MMPDPLHRNRLESLGELAASLAHELNQPLNVIRIACENLILHMPEDDAYARAKLDKIVGQVERAGKIIATIGIFSRRRPQKSERFGLRGVLNDIEELIAHPLALKGIRLVVEAPAVLPFLEGDAILLDQMLLNLVTNARDAILEARRRGAPPPAGGDEIRITLGDWTKSTDILIKVADTGIGLSEVDSEAIFDPFVTTKGDSGGTGLGLALCRKIALTLGGSIQCRTLPQGGAEFCILLPLPRQRRGAENSEERIGDE